ncbi:hypothetical protein ACCO45_008469 [Purpureocillium lilacinum]|uniref:Uncharacterized protein n=1 Tax=Purpureocillium lilacinum TaxID=33203 RepID=A0ACC4DNR8_PURLI
MDQSLTKPAKYRPVASLQASDRLPVRFLLFPSTAEIPPCSLAASSEPFRPTSQSHQANAVPPTAQCISPQLFLLCCDTVLESKSPALAAPPPIRPPPSRPRPGRARDPPPPPLAWSSTCLIPTHRRSAHSQPPRHRPPVQRTAVATLGQASALTADLDLVTLPASKAAAILSRIKPCAPIARVFDAALFPSDPASERA